MKHEKIAPLEWRAPAKRIHGDTGRRALLQAAAAVAALGGDAFGRSGASRRKSDLLRLQGDRPGHAAQLHRPACPAHAALFPRAVGQHRRRVGSRPAAAPRRREAAGGLQGRPRQRRCLCAGLRPTSRRWRATYGRLGGLDRLSTLIKAIRAERGAEQGAAARRRRRPGRAATRALQTKGGDMVKIMNALKPDAMTAHWEFTYGASACRS